MLAHALNPSTQKAEVGESLTVLGQPDINSNWYTASASHGYTVRSCLQKQNKTPTDKPKIISTPQVTTGLTSFSPASMLTSIWVLCAQNHSISNTSNLQLKNKSGHIGVFSHNLRLLPQAALNQGLSIHSSWSLSNSACWAEPLPPALCPTYFSGHSRAPAAICSQYSPCSSQSPSLE